MSMRDDEFMYGSSKRSLWGGGGINEMKNEKNVKIPFKNTHQ